METMTVNTADMIWEELSLFPGTGDMKMLRNEPQGRTMLVRLAAGGKIVPHSHLGAVQHYVLEVEYESEGKTFLKGTYRFLLKDTDVSPITTKGGVTILMIYDAIQS
jgi:hypothetical protein